MSTKNIKQATKKQSRKNQAQATQVEVKVPETQVQVVVSKDPAQRTGLRGLRGLVMARFSEAFSKSKDFAKLPTMDELTKEVAEHYPQSRWLARPKVHYSYYKSKFISATKAA